MQAKKLRALLPLLAVGVALLGPTSALASPGTVTLESPDFRATVTASNTGVTHFGLKDPRYERDGKPIDLL